MAHSQRTEQETLVRATLEVDTSAPAPRRALTSAEGRRLAFSGWSELAVAVTRIARKRSAIVIATAAIGVFAAFGAQSAAARAIHVTNTDDSGTGSLRTAIDKANQLSGFDRVVIDATGKIALQSPLPTVATSMTIRGSGPNILSIDASAAPDTPLLIEPVGPCVPASDCQVTVRGVSINHADTAIGDHGVLDLVDSRLSDNTTAIRANGPAEATRILRSTLSANDTGIQNDNGSNSTPLRVLQSTVIDNQDYGVLNINAETVIARSTLSGNGYAVLGAGEAHTSVTQSTLNHNTSGIDGFGFFGPAGTATLRSTIVANSSSENCNGVTSNGVTSQGFNLADDASCDLTAKGDQPNTKPLLLPLANYGGPTKTFALQPTSPAIDAGVAGTLATDQRGEPLRVDYPGVPMTTGGDNSDIGAFELQAP